MVKADEAKREELTEITPTPFLKWAGGKRWFAQNLPFSREEITGVYYEPFLGSGAVFFSLQPDRAVLADVNRNLIDTYIAIARSPDEITRYLREHDRRHSKEYYYEVRSKSFNSPEEKAAQFIYLNRVCWNGLYRVNRRGEFNVPIGTKSSALIESDNFRLTAKALAGKEIVCADFEGVIDRAGSGDLVFADPPYTVRHRFNGFVKYNEKLFSWADQLRLREALLRASHRGARVICTNADHASVRAVYGRDFQFQELHRYSSIAGSGGVRGNFTEILITNQVRAGSE